MQQFKNIQSLCGLLVLVVLASCQTAKPVHKTAKKSSQPKFIEGIYLNGHNKTIVATNAIEPKKAPMFAPVGSLRKAEISAPTVHTPKLVAMAGSANSNIDVTSATTNRRNQTDNFISEPSVDNVIVSKYTDMIGLSLDNVVNKNLYSFIDRWYGTSYRLGGEDESGIDCSGFARKLYGEVYGMELTRTAMDQFKDCKRFKAINQASEGDLVFFKQKGRRITHVGVYLGNDYFVHSSTSQGVVISSLKDAYWQKHYAGAGRLVREEYSEQL